MTRSSSHRSTNGEQLGLYKNALIWDTKLSTKLNDHRVVEENERENRDVDQYRRKIQTGSRCSDNQVRDTSSNLRKKQHTTIENSEYISQVWDYFARQTTFHGVKNIVSRERGRYSRLLWLLLVTGMSGGMMYTVAVLLMEYYQYNTVTKTDIKINEWSTFPSVTLCNTCPYKNVDKSTDTPLFRLLASQGIFLESAVPLNISDPGMQELFQSDVFQIQEKYTFTAEELFFSAQFENEVLNISEAFENSETILGRCFTFNGPDYISKNGPRMTRLVGRESGLRIYVHLFQDQYFIFDDLTAGIRMFVANHPDTPRLRQDGIDIHPGTSTRLALTPVKYTFLPAPYKSYGDKPCLQTDSQDLRHKMINASFYSYDNCLEQCHSYKASLACSCYTHLLYVPNLQRCTVGDLVACFVSARENLTAADCDCPRPCSFVHYDTTLSASQIPSRVSADLLTKLINVSSAEELRYRYLLPGNNVQGEDYLEIRVYLDTMMMRHERHESQYTFSSIFAFLGGQMGFFIGASLITLAEILEAILLSVYTFFHKHLMRMGQLVVRARPPPAGTSPKQPHLKPDKRRAW